MFSLTKFQFLRYPSCSTFFECVLINTIKTLLYKFFSSLKKFWNSRQFLVLKKSRTEKTSISRNFKTSFQFQDFRIRDQDFLKQKSIHLNTTHISNVKTNFTFKASLTHFFTFGVTQCSIRIPHNDLYAMWK